MGQNPKRTPDGYNRTAGGGGDETPTPKLVVADFPDIEIFGLVGRGIVLEAAPSMGPITLAGFGFTEAEALFNLALVHIPGPPPPPDPAAVNGGTISATDPAGSVPGTITCTLTGSQEPNDIVGTYTLSVTTASGKTGCVRVQINPAA